MTDTQPDTQTTGTFTVKVPDVGEGVAEVEIVTWVVQVGDAVARLQTVAEVMTDKATVEVPSPIDGVVAELGGAVGDVLLVGSALLRLTVGGGDRDQSPDPDPALDPDPRPGPDPDPIPAAPELHAPRSTEPPAGVEMRPHSTGAPLAGINEPERPAPATPARRPVTARGPQVLATPAVRRRARDGGIDLRRVSADGYATGPAGRVSHEDLDSYLAAGSESGTPNRSAASGRAPAARARRTGVEEQPVVGLRRRIAQQMVASASTIPHITYVEEVDVTALEELRASLNERATTRPDQPRLTILPFLIRALTNSLVEFPRCNAHLIDDPSRDGPDTLSVHEGVHVGIATQTDNGLIVPVLRHAEAKTIWSTAATMATLAEATRNGTAAVEDLSGSTITITSLGPLGGIVTTPVINKPEVVIVGVNKIVIRPVWIDGEFVPRKIMNLSSSFDHRVIDGWDAANFVQAIRAQMEQPAMLFIDDVNET